MALYFGLRGEPLHFDDFKVGPGLEKFGNYCHRHFDTP